MTDREVLLDMFDRAKLDYCRFDETNNDAIYVLISSSLHLGFYFDEEDGSLDEIRNERH